MKTAFKLLLVTLLTLTIALSALGFAACGEDEKTIKIGASPTPHAEILKEIVADELRKEGYKLEVVEFSDYVQPNIAVENGDLDANYFQHNLYLKEFNESRKTHLKSVANVHYEAFGIYRGSYKNGAIADLPAGSVVLVPNDATNEARALFLLQAANLITLNENVGFTQATKHDIASNPKNLVIQEIEAAQIPNSLIDGAIGVVNGNYALGAKLPAAILYEDIPESEQEQYVNVIAVKEGKEDSPKIQALIKAITSKAVKDYVEQKYNGAVVTVF